MRGSRVSSQQPAEGSRLRGFKLLECFPDLREGSIQVSQPDTLAPLELTILPAKIRAIDYAPILIPAGVRGKIGT
jgi:hypothetical protein